MPKQKTRKSISRRFRVTKSGKVLARHAFRRHLKIHKSKKSLTNLKRPKEITGYYAKKLRRAMNK